jgi:hypothetical protein
MTRVSYVATVVEAAVDEKGHLTAPRVDTAIDCGFAANPERIRSQIPIVSAGPMVRIRFPPARSHVRTGLAALRDRPEPTAS